MAEGDGKDDVLIKVGAEADTEGAQQKILAEFDKMRSRLKDIATDEAQALAEQISAVTKGLREGTVDPKSVEAVAAAFTKIASAAELSDREISGFTSQLKTAVDKSRSLSDYMHKVEDGADKGAKFSDDLKGAIADISPEAGRFTGEVGKWLNRIPGVNGLIGSMGKLAGGVAIAFGAVVAAVAGVAKSLRAANDAMRQMEERSRSIRAENAENARTNALGRIDLDASRRKAEADHKKAMLELEKETMEYAYDRAEAEMNINELWGKRREWNSMQIARDKAEDAYTNEAKRLDLERDENLAQREDIEKRRNAEEEYLNSLRDQLDAAVAKRDQYKAGRSAIMENAEARQTLIDAGIDVEDPGAWERIKEAIGDGLLDQFKDIKSWFNGEENTEEKNQQYEKFFAEARRLQQQIAEQERKVESVDNDLEANRRDMLRISGERSRSDAANVARKNRERAEDVERMRSEEERIAGRRMEMSREGNRLTAMGLGSGNAAANASVETAMNTKAMLGKMDVLIAATKGISMGEWSEGIKADTWAL